MLDKMLVAIASWVERRERMWVRIDFGRVLIMSALVLVLVLVSERAFCLAEDR